MPGQSVVVRFTFYPRADGPVGLYSMRMLMQTNAPACPYLEIDLTGTALAGALP